MRPVRGEGMLRHDTGGNCGRKMTDSRQDRPGKGIDTRLAHAGRHPERYHGFVNPPVYRGSTVLYPDAAMLASHDIPYPYGRTNTPTIEALAEALAEIEGAAGCLLAPSGLAAIGGALLAFVEAGDHILVADSVYRPTRRFCDEVLARLGVTTHYYDPLAGAGIAALMRPDTRLVFVESPGSQTMEVQDIPAIAEAARARGARVLMDNTWATPLYFRPFEKGVDVSIHAGTKYIVGHSDAMLGAVTGTAEVMPALQRAWRNLGACAGTEEMFLALRGLRTLSVRLSRHMAAGIEIAGWLRARPEVAAVLHPALDGAPGHALWRRDFTGASGLFSVVLKPAGPAAVAAMLDGLELFGLGYSWGGFESLVIAFDPADYRTATRWTAAGPALRFHIGLEDVDDLKADLAAGFARLAAAR